jgi:hypothetical protein
MWSVDDDAMPLTFFDPKTGDFVDSAQARVRSKLVVNFGNPYKEKRANSLIPEKYLSQAPSLVKDGSFGSSTSERISSPPHDSFDSVEEGEAIFVLNSPSRKSPKREENDESISLPTLPTKRPRSDSDDESIGSVGNTSLSSSRSSNKSSLSNTSTPPPRPPPPKSSSLKSISGSNSSRQPPPPAPPPRSKGNAPPPPPPPPLPPSTSVAAATTKKFPPLAPPTIVVQRQPPKPPIPQVLEKSENNNQTKPDAVAPEDLTKAICTPPIPTKSSENGSDISSKIRVSEAQRNDSLGKIDDNIEWNVSIDHPLPDSQQKVANVQPSIHVEQQDRPESSSSSSPVVVFNDETMKPNVSLLPGWICVWSKSKQRWYFFHTKSNRSVWDWPPPPL